MIVDNLNMIVAVGNNYEIGRKNELLCHLPNDLKHFKEITSGHTVIMGENTYLSLPHKPLPGRKNIVVTLNEMQVYAACYMAYSIDQALALSKNDEKVFVMGGASIYRQMLPMTSVLYLTRIHADFPDADAFFPALNLLEWNLQEEIKCKADEKHPYGYSFCKYIRK